MKMEDREIIDSVGIEMEFSCFDRNLNKFIKQRKQRLPDYQIVHDASCETPIDLFAGTGLTIEFEDKKDRNKMSEILQRTVIGGEIISPIRHSGKAEWVKEIYNLCDLLDDFGETEESKRDAFHVHVNVSKSIPLFAMKNLLRLTGNLEKILFRLGGMGRENRGEENHYVFSRPFLGNGPPVVRIETVHGIKNYPICNFDDMMNAETKREFFDRFGDSSYFAERGTRYVTQRYMVVNFYPIIKQGSFEFRPANKTLNPEYIIAWTNFCKAFVEKAFLYRDEESYEKVQRPLYENREISHDEFLNAISYLPMLDTDTISVLSEIWHKSPSPTFDNIWRFSHLRQPTYWGSGNYYPEFLAENVDVEQADFVDIHHLENEGENEPRIHIPRRVRNGVRLNPEMDPFDPEHLILENLWDGWIATFQDVGWTIHLQRNADGEYNLECIYNENHQFNRNILFGQNVELINMFLIIDQLENNDINEPNENFIPN